MKEIKITLNTQNGQSSFKTDIITGGLYSIILESLERISIIIESELGYIIFKKADIKGIYYLSIRDRSIAPEEDMKDIANAEKFYLNESLIITIMGQANKDVSIILRTE